MNGPLRMSDKQWDKMEEHLLRACAAAKAERDQAKWQPILEALSVATVLVGWRARERTDRLLQSQFRYGLRRVNRRVKKADEEAKERAKIPF